MPIVSDPLKAQGFRTQRAELPEDLWQPLYDRANYPTAGANQVAFFSIPQGQTATIIRNGTATSVVKGYLETNMQNANVVPTKLFKFVGISLAFIHASDNTTTNTADRDKVRGGGYLQFRIVDKDILFLPLVCIPEVNPFTVAATTATTATILGTAGGGGYGVPMYKLPIPITLNPYENFSLTINFPTLTTVTTTLDIYVVLQGYMRRPT